MFVQIGHVVSGHLLFDKEVLNSKITGIFRSPIALITLIQSTLHDIQSTSTSTGTESKFRKFFEHEYYKDKTGRYHYFWHWIPVPAKFLNRKPTGIFWFDNKIWEQYEFEIDWMMENFPPFSPLVLHGTVKQAPPGGGLEDTSTLLKMLTRKQNNSSISSQEIITSFYLQIISTLFLQNFSNIMYNETLPIHMWP